MKLGWSSPIILSKKVRYIFVRTAICCAVLSCDMLSCAMLSCAMLCCVVLCCALLHFTPLYYALLYHTPRFSAMILLPSSLPISLFTNALFIMLKPPGGNAGFPDMSYRCAGHGKDDVALTGNLTYTGIHIRVVLC